MKRFLLFIFLIISTSSLFSIELDYIRIGASKNDIFTILLNDDWKINKKNNVLFATKNNEEYMGFDIENISIAFNDYDQVYLVNFFFKNNYDDPYMSSYSFNDLIYKTLYTLGCTITEYTKSTVDNLTVTHIEAIKDNVGILFSTGYKISDDFFIGSFGYTAK